mmetsp:Transcript_12202/g.20392  ORF Transcript_12202/g.20392 Transcript_12202/m.20392 type:complete len:151 (-) Transcript_12202:799-1251(-)|eukprot:CAMPEP_0174983732 /NCGR_PEP_ID=MMETSP0004_2-20121128/17316_1 /TAXON_ID=420556 /ORGANISM="Ochromonas sp., Strain CCMP1393" /LENGTH=150 /DNA_ID=CAMNT_0016236035 /DNA_START=677 /DNA_END=1129 /DNA_ORIENTATION=-
MKQVIVVAATNRPDMLDPALIRPGRIDRKVYVSPPDAESRKQILKIELSRMPLEESTVRQESPPSPPPAAAASSSSSSTFDDLTFHELVSATDGFSGAEIVAACSEAAMLAIEEAKSALSVEHLLRAIRAVKPQITPRMLQFYSDCAKQL